jgi:hypothetical protein
MFLIHHFTDTFPCTTDMAAHEDFRQFPIAGDKCVDDVAVLL